MFIFQHIKNKLKDKFKQTSNNFFSYVASDKVNDTMDTVKSKFSNLSKECTENPDKCSKSIEDASKPLLNIIKQGSKLIKK